jgi:RNA polymerase sigma-70 factor (ECF subfamily)
MDHMQDTHCEEAERSGQAAQENERLARAIAEGDRDAERTFALLYLPRVRAMLLARTRNPELAADLQQDVMIEAICALRRGQLREAHKLPGFVLAIARNLLNNHYRGAARQPDSLEFPDDLPDLAKAADEVDEKHRQTLALSAIATLAPADKAILQMTLVDGLKPGEIARRLRLSPGSVRQRKLRATRRIVDFVANMSQNRSAAHSIARGEP